MDKGANRLSVAGSRSNRSTTLVTLFLPSLRCGGAERMTVNLANALVEVGVSVDLVLSRAVGELLSQVPPRVRVVDFGVSKVRQSVFSLASYLRRTQPAALIARMQHVNIAAAMAHWMAGSTTRLVLTEATHGSLFANEGRLIRRLKNRCIMGPLTRRAYRRADAIVAVSHGVAADLAERLSLAPAGLRVIPNPVLTNELARLSAEPPNHPWLRDLCPARRSPAKEAVILAVGSLREAKDFATLLRAFAILREEMAARLIIYGEGPERERLEQLRRELRLIDSVQLPGFEPNPYSAMARASLFALSSRREGSPNVLVEALACGCPVVATDCPSGPAEIVENGRIGILAPVGDPHALASAMKQSLLTQWNADQLRQRARNYDSHETALRYLDLIGLRPGSTSGGSAAQRAAA